MTLTPGGTVSLGMLTSGHSGFEGDAPCMIDKEREARGDSHLTALLKSMPAEEKGKQVFVCTFYVPHKAGCNGDAEDSRAETSDVSSLYSEARLRGAETLRSIVGSVASGSAAPPAATTVQAAAVPTGTGSTAKLRSSHGLSSATIAQWIREESFKAGLLVEVWNKDKVDEWLKKLLQPDQMPSKRQK